jgi:hypothetical protein
LQQVCTIHISTSLSSQVCAVHGTLVDSVYMHSCGYQRVYAVSEASVYVGTVWLLHAGGGKVPGLALIGLQQCMEDALKHLSLTLSRFTEYYTVQSLCYQLPAIVSESICLVVSPLISLAKDQVDNWNARGSSLDAQAYNCTVPSYVKIKVPGPGILIVSMKAAFSKKPHWPRSTFPADSCACPCRLYC